MSQAFVKESDGMLLSDVGASINALLVYLSAENNGIRVYVQKNFTMNGKEIYQMSDGLSYAKDEAGKWFVEI